MARSYSKSKNQEAAIREELGRGAQVGKSAQGLLEFKIDMVEDQNKLL